MTIIVAIFSWLYYVPKGQQTRAASEIIAKPIEVTKDDWAPKFNPNIEIMQTNADSTTSGDPGDFSNAIKSAPDGLKIPGLFKLGVFPSKTNGEPSKNDAVIIDENTITNFNNSILQVTNNKQQLGAIWSDSDKGNYIDVSMEEQELSMWLYFGKTSESLQNSDVGDGMAFVLQNNKDAVKQIATYHKGQSDQTLGFGESMGVWGTDFDTKETNPASISATAIPNSFAIEFDTFPDKAYLSENIHGNGNSFDYDVIKSGIYTQHIATGFPGNQSTYQSRSSGSKNYFIMNHQNPKPMSFSLTNQKWHHVTLRWQKHDYDDNGSIIMKFNDKSINGDRIEPRRVTSINQEINLKNDLNLKDGDDTKLTWGFTGSTGTYFENNLISFESIPSQVEGNADVKIINESIDKPEEQEVKSGGSVYGGDNLNFQYKLTYISGIKPWKDTDAKIDIPKNIKVKSIDVVYADGTNDTIDVETAKDKNIDNRFSFKLKNPLKDQDPVNPTAFISIRGIVKPVKETTNVDSAHSRFKSEYLIRDVQTPQFKIDFNNKWDLLNLSVDEPNPNKFPTVVDAPDRINGKYRVWKSNNTSTNGVTIEWKINGVSQPDLNPKYISEQFDNNYSFSKEKLKHGNNKIEFWAKQNGKYSPKQIVNVIVTGSLSLGEVSNAEFPYGNSDTSNTLVSSKGKWNIPITDTRYYKKSKWRLNVSSTPLYRQNDQKKFNGNLVFKKDKSSNVIRIDDGNFVEIETQELEPNTQGGEVNYKEIKTNAGKNWNEDSGILLRINGNNPSGKYKSQLTWSLTDSISNKS